MKSTAKQNANTRRVLKIYRTLLTEYNEARSRTMTPDEVHDGIVDLLADIRHYCDSEGFDLGKLDRIAHDHYLAELTS